MTTEQPLVSICVPAYNAAETIAETLDSILKQSYPNILIHVSENASIDNTLQVLESIDDERIIIHRNAVNVSGEDNFNRCIEIAEGKYTAIFHADDVYETDMVAKQVAFLEAFPEAGAAFTEASLIDENGKSIGEMSMPEGMGSSQRTYDFERILKAVLQYSNFLICPSVMVRTDIYQHEIKGWRGELFRSSADLDLWLRILQKHRIGLLPEKLMRYRISQQQFSARVRFAVERADFFLVTDYYLAQDSVRNMLAVEDLRNYQWLERRDRVMRAVNLLLTDSPKKARKLLYDLLSFDALYSAVKTRRGFLVMILGMYVLFVISIGLTEIGKKPLLYFKRVFGK